jgi:hypothetical protein
VYSRHELDLGRNYFQAPLADAGGVISERAFAEISGEPRPHSRPLPKMPIGYTGRVANLLVDIPDGGYGHVDSLLSILRSTCSLL